MTVRLDGNLMTDRSTLHDYLVQQFGLPQHYGRNLDALYDLLSERGEVTLIELTEQAVMLNALGSYGKALIDAISHASEDNPNLTFHPESKKGGNPMQRNIVDALIEIPLGSKNKYELDKQSGRIRLDRVLYAAMIYPAEYGIVENTLAPDGDPLDILVICSDPTFPGCIVPARVLGYLEMIDGGKLDYKLISVVDCDPRYDDVTELEHLSPFVLKEIANFFSNYKVLQGVTVEVGQYFGKEEAVRIIQQCRDAYIAK